MGLSSKNKDRNIIKSTQNKNRYRKIKLLWGCMFRLSTFFFSLRIIILSSLLHIRSYLSGDDLLPHYMPHLTDKAPSYYNKKKRR